MRSTTAAKVAVSLAVAALLGGLASSPAMAAPTPPPGTTPTPITWSLKDFVVPNVAFPSCKAIMTTTNRMLIGEPVVFLGDRHNPTTHTGYGTALRTEQRIIENNNGRNCTWMTTGSRTVFTLSLAPISNYDYSSIARAWSAGYGTTGTGTGGRNVIFGTSTPPEATYLLEDGAVVALAVSRSDARFFPALIQNVADQVYYLNH
jgi:hypothetical protein